MIVHISPYNKTYNLRVQYYTIRWCIGCDYKWSWINSMELTRKNESYLYCELNDTKHPTTHTRTIEMNEFKQMKFHSVYTYCIIIQYKFIWPIHFHLLFCGFLTMTLNRLPDTWHIWTTSSFCLVHGGKYDTIVRYNSTYIHTFPFQPKRVHA